MGKIDCKITVNFLREQERICKAFGHSLSDAECDKCPIGQACNNDNYEYCPNWMGAYPVKAIAIVQKWSDEHPVKTIKEDFLEKYPQAVQTYDDLPVVCAKHLGYGVVCFNDCAECWNRPLEEVQK